MRVSPRVPFILTAFIAAMLATQLMPAHSECLSSAEAVWKAHPGSHATWRLHLPGHEGEKCWFGTSKSKVTGADDSRGADREIRPVGATGAPLPRPRSQDALADTNRAPMTGADDSKDVPLEIIPVGVMAAPSLPPRSQDTLTSTDRAPLRAFAKPPSTGDAASVLMIWGTPMRIDATWEDLFAGRERRAE